MPWLTRMSAGGGCLCLASCPALLVLFIRRNVPESPEWTEHGAAAREGSFPDVIRRHFGLVVYAVAMMAAFNFFSHGTQDLYKSFLSVEHKLPVSTVTTILIFMNLAAMSGGLIFASLSQRIGRRRAIVSAALLSLPVLPLWAFAQDPIYIGVGAFLMQLFVQGAWGVIPAHLNELSPAAVRGTFPGLTYQLGNLIASGNATIQTSMADKYFHKNLSWPLAIVVGTVAVVIAILVGFGREAREVRMGRERVDAVEEVVV